MKAGATLAFSLFLGLILHGCGSGGGSAPGDGGGGTGGAGSGAGGTLIWQDDGATHRAGFAAASLVHGATLDLLQITGGESTGIGISFGVGSRTPPIVAGTYQCAQTGTGPIVSFAYTAPNVDPVYTSCTIWITTIGVSGGTHCTGTFSAVFPLTGSGGSKAITAGTFDLPLTVN
jgi:hypothetical protein